ncbi:hypothetical protein THAOC_01595 [Thalassiosira oceanica]|uniref:Uncharacterized protein n=1 Tax=Thalassiosira oceanica TaxID=159749 RepID=K0TQU0_THAOC|nr:hypothetical protein THAOC_01595 [Thalassiosira oceanica]|eukprot:EJK76632.1 hypothetical protein THAOC_01595 [Thalassiosira oceanica]
MRPPPAAAGRPPSFSGFGSRRSRRARRSHATATRLPSRWGIHMPDRSPTALNKLAIPTSASPAHRRAGPDRSSSPDPLPKPKSSAVGRNHVRQRSLRSVSTHFRSHTVTHTAKAEATSAPPATDRSEAEGGHDLRTRSSGQVTRPLATQPQSGGQAVKRSSGGKTRRSPGLRAHS